MQPTDTTPSVSPQPVVTPEVQPQVIDSPTVVNWGAELFAKKTEPEETQQPQPTQPAAVETPEATEQPQDAQPQEEATPQTEPEQPQPEAPEEVTVTEADQALYDSIAAELKAQYPNADPILLKRLIDDKFTVKQLLAKDEKKSKQISQLLKRVTKKDPPQRVVTEFERKLQTPETPVPPPAIPQPQVAPPAVAQPQQQQQIPDHLNWRDAQDAFNAEAQAWAEYGDPDATSVQREAAAKKLAQIRDLQHRFTMQSMMSDVDKLAEQKARQMIEAQLGDVLPAIRQTAAEKQAEAVHSFAVQELTKAGLEGISEMTKPTSVDPLTYDGREYDDTPLNRILVEHPFINRINVTHDASGKPFPRDVAMQLTQIERYRAAHDIWSLQRGNQAQAPAAQPGTPTPDTTAVQQAYQAGLTAQQKAEADRARQGLNAGQPATSTASTMKPETLADEYRKSGPVNYGSLLFGNRK